MKMQNYKLSTLLTSPIAVPHQQSGETSVHPQCLHLLLLNSWTTFATAYINMYDRLNFVTDLFEVEYYFFPSNGSRKENYSPHILFPGLKPIHMLALQVARL